MNFSKKKFTVQNFNIKLIVQIFISNMVLTLVKNFSYDLTECIKKGKKRFSPKKNVHTYERYDTDVNQKLSSYIDTFHTKKKK